MGLQRIRWRISQKKLHEGISAETLVSEVLLQEPKDNITAIIINII